jgi:hypothetical protein
VGYNEPLYNLAAGRSAALDEAAPIHGLTSALRALHLPWRSDYDDKLLSAMRFEIRPSFGNTDADAVAVAEALIPIDELVNQET